MEATKATERNQDSRSQTTSLNDRYGKIGISAVAGAVQHRPEPRPASASRFIPIDSD